MRVRHVRADEGEQLRDLRLRSLSADPAAFGATLEGDRARPAAWWLRGARRSAAGEEQRTFVAVDDAERWIGLALVRRDGDEAVINAMWVAPEARRRGAGRALLDACVAWAAGRGYGAVRLSVKADNAAARAVYAAAGFALARLDGDEHVLTRQL